jgi:multidrug efflux pump subunit AcrB
MDFLTRFGINHSRVTVLVIAAMLLLGLMQYKALPKREDPAVTSRVVVVSAQSPGLAPERVENLIAIPIERKAREIGEISDIDTQVMPGVAIVRLEVSAVVPDAQLDLVFEEIRNKMATLQGKFPEGTQGPTVNTDYGDVVISTVAVTGDGFSLAEVQDAAESLQSRLYEIHGVGKVSLWGVQEEQIKLEFDSKKLAAIGVQIPTLLSDLQAQNVIAPAGRINAGGTELSLEVNGDLGTLEDIENVLTKIEGIGSYVRLKDLLTVRRDFENPASKPVWFNGQPAVMVAIEMNDGQDIQKVGKTTLQATKIHEQTQAIGIAYGISTYQEAKVTAAINGALSNVGQTFLIVLGVMFLFLGFRSGLIVASIVPLSAAVALVGMSFLGIALEQVSIAAVIISLGLLVDNGLVIVEDIQSRITRGDSPRAAAESAGKQFVLPLAVASITTASAFIPMLILDGTEGEFAFSLGAVVALMLMGSWFSAMYVLPTLCVWFLKEENSEKVAKPSRLVTLYEKTLGRMMSFSLVVVLASYALTLSSALFLFPHLNKEMFPLSERDQFLIYMDMPRGTAIEHSATTANRVQAWLSNEQINPEIANTTVYVGDGGPRFYLALSPADTVASSAFFLVNTHNFEGAIAAADRAQKHFYEQFPEARFKVKRLAMGGGESGLVNIRLDGPDAGVLLAEADKLEAMFSRIPQVIQNENNWGNRILKVVVNISQEKARDLGVSSESVSEALDSYFTGTTISTFREGDKQIPITVRVQPYDRDSLDDIRNLTISANGQLISLDQVADVDPVLDYSQIRRHNQQRRIEVTAKANNMSAQDLVDLVDDEINVIRRQLPPGYTLSIGGEVEDSAETNAKLAAGMPAALLVMLLALMVQFNSFRRVSLTLASIPLVVIGAPVLLLLSNQPLSFFATLGMISLAGIIINNAIVLIDQIDIERLTMELRSAIVKASAKRFTPVMLTSLTTVLGLLPMAISGGALFEPMATIMIGGLVVASIFSLFFVPAAYYILFYKSDNKTLKIT